MRFIQIIFGMLVLILSMGQNAYSEDSDSTNPDESAPARGRYFLDPIFIPFANQVYTQASTYSFSSPYGDTYNIYSHKINSFRGSNNLVNNFIAYGITDDFSFHSAIGYGFNTLDVKPTNTLVTQSSFSSGFTNPVMGVTYRALNPSYDSPYIFDLVMNYSPDLFPSKIADPTTYGTIATGRQVGTIQGVVGRVEEDFTLSGNFSASYSSKSSSAVLSNHSTITQNPVLSYVLGISTQSRLTDRLSLNCGPSFTIPGNTPRTTDFETHSSWTTIPSLVSTLNTGVNYQIIPERLAGTLSYSFSYFTPTAAHFTQASSNVDIRNHYSNVVGASLSYLFSLD